MRNTTLLSRHALAISSHFRSISTQKLFLVVLLIVDAFFFAYYASAFYPGYLTSDSLYMLSQGVGNQAISNWHPPFITIIWGVLHGIFKSAGGVWIFQISLLILAAHFFSTGLRNKAVVLSCLCLILIFPPVFTNMAALWKDNWAVIFTLFCAGFALRGIRSHSLLHAHAAGFFFVLASLTRIDYLIIVTPIALGAFLFYEKERDRTKWYARTVFYSFTFYFLVFIAGSQWAGSLIEKKFNPWATIAIWDIGGVLNESELKSSLPGYRCTTSDPLVFGDYRLFSINLPEGAELNNRMSEATMIRQTWIDAIANHPTAYLRHRLCVAKQFFGLEKEVHYPYPSPVFVKNPLTQSAERSALNLDLYWFYDSHAHGLMFKYFVYLIACFLIVGIAYLARFINPIQLILFASICMSAARFIVLPAADFRYGLWIVVGTTLLIAVFMDELIDRLRIKVTSMKLNSHPYSK